jgi:hypothetical protein
LGCFEANSRALDQFGAAFRGFDLVITLANRGEELVDAHIRKLAHQHFGNPYPIKLGPVVAHARLWYFGAAAASGIVSPRLDSPESV